MAGHQAQKPEARNELGFSSIVLERDDSLAAICGKLDAARSRNVAIIASRGNDELARLLACGCSCGTRAELAARLCS